MNFYFYDRMFKGTPREVTLVIEDPSCEEAEMIFNSDFRDHIEDTENILNDHIVETMSDRDENEDRIEFENDSLTFRRDKVYIDHIQGNEESVLDIDTFKDIVESAAEEFSKDPEDISIKSSKEILKDIGKKVVLDSSEKLSFPVISDEEHLGFFVVPVDEETRTVMAPTMICKADIKTGSLTDMIGDELLDFCDAAEGSHELPVLDEYSEDYMDSLLDILDSVRYDLIKNGRIRMSLYSSYMDGLTDCVPDALMSYFRTISIDIDEPEEPEEMPEEPEAPEAAEEPETPEENKPAKITFEDAMKDDEEDDEPKGFFAFFRKKK